MYHDQQPLADSYPPGWDVVDTSTPGGTPTNQPEVMAQPSTGRSPGPVMLTCCLCGQRYDAMTGPCGCGKRPLRRMTHKEVNAFMEGTAVLIPVKILKEWRRGLMTVEAGLLAQHHAQEIKKEIEAYINAAT